MRRCYLCAKEIAIERRHSVFCSLRCEQTYQALERRTPPVENPSAQPATEFGRPRQEWPATVGPGEEP